MGRATLVAFGVGVLLVFGCSTEPVTDAVPGAEPAATSTATVENAAKSERISPPCRDTVKLAAAEPDSAAAEPLIAATLDACTSAGEWLAAARQDPGILGVRSAEFIEDSDIELVCLSYKNSAVCRDAGAKGLLP